MDPYRLLLTSLVNLVYQLEMVLRYRFVFVHDFYLLFLLLRRWYIRLRDILLNTTHVFLGIHDQFIFELEWLQLYDWRRSSFNSFFISLFILVFAIIHDTYILNRVILLLNILLLIFTFFSGVYQEIFEPNFTLFQLFILPQHIESLFLLQNFKIRLFYSKYVGSILLLYGIVLNLVLFE